MEVLDLLAAFRSSNPLEPTSETKPAAATLAAADISNGTYTPPSGLNLILTNDTTLLGPAAAAVAPRAFVLQGNGWSIVMPSMTGNFGADYGLHTAVVSSGHLMLKSRNALYPAWGNNAGGSRGLRTAQYSLGPNELYFIIVLFKTVTTKNWLLGSDGVH